MDLGRALWAEYLERVCPSESDRMPAIERLRPAKVAELIWPIGFEIDARCTHRTGAEPSSEFNQAADEILIALARTGDLLPSELASAGAWELLRERFGLSIIILLLEEENPEAASIPVPVEAPIEVRRIAAALVALGTLGRSPPMLVTRPARS